MLRTNMMCLKRNNNFTSLRLYRGLQTENLSYLKNPGIEPLSFATLGNVLEATAHKYPNRVAIKSLHEGVTFSYEELLTKADSLGCALRANGFEKGDRIGIWSHNCSEWVISVLAAARAGLTSVFLNPMYGKDELKFCINKIQLKGMIFGNNIKNIDYYKLLNNLIPELQTSKAGELHSEHCPSLRSIICMGKDKLDGVTTMTSLLNNYQNSSDITKYGNEIKSQDEVFIIMTSGTTGTPKGVLDSHHAIVNNTYFNGKRLNFHGEAQVVCLQSPLFHGLGSVITLLAALRHGSTTVLASPMYNITDTMKALISEKCTIVSGTPTMYVDLMSLMKSSTPLRLRTVFTAGASCSTSLKQQMHDRLKVRVIEGYGLTEVAGCVFQSLLDESVDMVSDTVGYICDHVETKVVDDNGNMLPFGSVGELMIRVYSNMLRYWDEPERTKKVLQDDGWFHTGDQFKIFANGYGSLVGRIKDVIIRGGENIAPAEVENVLNSHPDIIESQVIGVPDDRLGEEICAVITVRENSSINLESMKKFCSEKLAKFKIPRMLKIVDNFPYNSTGKIKKNELKQLVESGKI